MKFLVPEGDMKQGPYWEPADLEWPVNLSFFLVYVNWNTFLYVREETLVFVLKILDAIIQNLVTHATR
jgi:hypothetical protein